MTIDELQKTVDEWIHTYGVRYFDILTNMAILTEETGEVARVVARGWGEQSFKPSEIDASCTPDEQMTFAKAKLAEELADLIWVAVAIANQTDINLELAIKSSIVKKTTRDKTRHLTNNKLKENKK